MVSILLGLGAAFAWGVHDLLVRVVSRAIAIPVALLIVLCVGTAVCLPLVLISGDWVQMSASVAMLSIAAGLAYVIGCIGLYHAFATGPVKLVAPIVGAYPVLSITWAELSGSAVDRGDWLAVLVIVTGVGLVAVLSDPDDVPHRRLAAALFATMSASGFAATFAFSQAAAGAGGEWSVILLIRVTAIILVLLLAFGSDFTAARPHAGALSGMGILDAIALGAITVAGSLPNPEFAAVVASIFGVITVLLARVFLREQVNMAQWASILLVFAGVAALGI